MSETRQHGVEARLWFVGLDEWLPCRLVQSEQGRYYAFDPAQMLVLVSLHAVNFGLNGRFPEYGGLRHAYFPIYLEGHGWQKNLWLVIQGYNQAEQRVKFTNRFSPFFATDFPKGHIISAAELAYSVIRTHEERLFTNAYPMSGMELQTRLVGSYAQHNKINLEMQQDSLQLHYPWDKPTFISDEIYRLITFPDLSKLVLKNSGMLVL